MAGEEELNGISEQPSVHDLGGEERLARLEVMAKSQTAVLRKSFVSKMKEKDDLIMDMLKTFKRLQVLEPIQAFASRNSRIGNWVGLATGETIEIGGNATDEEVQELRKERNDLRNMVKDLKSAMDSKGGDGAIKMKLKEFKKDVKKLEKEKSKLLAALQQAQGGEGGGGGGGDGAETAKLMLQVEKLKKKLEKAEKKGGKDGRGLSPPPPGAPPGPPPTAVPPAVDDGKVKALEEENAKLAKKLEESKAKYEKAKGKLEEVGKASLKGQEEILASMASEMEKLEVSSKKEIDEAKKEAAGKEEEIKKLAETVKKLTKTNEALKSSNSGLGVALSQLAKKSGTLTSEFKLLKSQVHASMKTDVPKIAKSTASQIAAASSNFMKSIEDLKVNYEKEVKERKRLFNLVQELRGNIRVFARCRPPSKKELSSGDESSTICVEFPADGEVAMKNEKGKEKNWEFDQVFNTGSTQEQVYKEVSPLVTSVLDGFNVCIFAYGQTGTGKTFTMMGPESNRGVNTRALYELFDMSQQRRSTIEDKITVSVLEVYNEQIKDLLAEDVGERKYTVREGPHGNYVPDLTMVNVDSLDEVIELLALADLNRSTAKTNMNEHSSRSHLILSCYIVSTNKHSGEVSRGKLHLIDLAGSERVGKSGAKGLALKEAQNINKSLSALGDVIAARGSGSSHIPFRNSTLTQLLQDSLSADSKTLMFVCISPVMYNSEEGFCSLNFAERARKVELGKATKNVVKAGK
ncbi:hypothetical protein TrST_g5623 [Triparma strigata]|uniref:Kinesin-like protein n=1 Tax=Triparma strigata TaxID=1606541 RepID=A0A9W6ZJM6_9STRA|nr:hypothetical protein TrST_g5623 [Triparma strigata]